MTQHVKGKGKRSGYRVGHFFIWKPDHYNGWFVAHQSGFRILIPGGCGFKRRRDAIAVIELTDSPEWDFGEGALHLFEQRQDILLRRWMDALAHTRPERGKQGGSLIFEGNVIFEEES